MDSILPQRLVDRGPILSDIYISKEWLSGPWERDFWIFRLTYSQRWVLFSKCCKKGQRAEGQRSVVMFWLEMTVNSSDRAFSEKNPTGLRCPGYPALGCLKPHAVGWVSLCRVWTETCRELFCSSFQTSAICHVGAHQWMSPRTDTRRTYMKQKIPKDGKWQRIGNPCTIPSGRVGRETALETTLGLDEPQEKKHQRQPR